MLNLVFKIGLLLCLYTGCGKANLSIGEQPINTPPSNFEGNSSLLLKVFLGGAYDSTTAKLRTTLNSSGYLPLSSPYGADIDRNIQISTATVPAGFFAAHPQITDWVQIEVRSDLSSSTSLLTRSVLLDENGNLVDLDGAVGITLNVAPGDYYIVIRHRNHLAAMTSAPVQTALAPTIVDLTLDPNSVLPLADGSPGGLIETADGNFAMVLGDLNQDGKVEYIADGEFLRLEVTNAPGNVTQAPNYLGHLGYLAADANLNGQARYSGVGADRAFIQTTILNSVNNVTLDNNYIIEMNGNI